MLDFNNTINGSVGNLSQVNGIDCGDKVAPSTVKTSPEYKEQLRKLAEWEGKSVSGYIRDALEFYRAYQPSGEQYDPKTDIRRKMRTPKTLTAIRALAENL